jgi:hypothetical protein
MKMSDQKETRIIYLGQCIYFDKKIESESKIAEKGWLLKKVAP